MILQWRPGRTSLTLLLVSIGVFGVAFAVRKMLLPDVVPIAATDDPQSLWALQLAFLLRALENIAAFGAAVVVVASIANWVAHRIGSPLRIARK